MIQGTGRKWRQAAVIWFRDLIKNATEGKTVVEDTEPEPDENLRDWPTTAYEELRSDFLDEERMKRRGELHDQLEVTVTFPLLFI